ncbi:hypothetical protein NMH_1221 [Neisseria meningitidis H44/76]|uniref:Uncharacterized protein n=1 Tax=Neisseria meningitidis serogroup B / serotype 15 (strain H44/76) TaxID=909420 RepID=E6MXY3_NEIMH|nr:hypothetical protein NMH_1221 [Neisseria meningitidis H44/76]
MQDSAETVKTAESMGCGRLKPTKTQKFRCRLKFRHSRENGNPAPWEQKLTPRHSRKSGNPVTEKPRESIGKNRTPRRRHSRERGNLERRI